MNIRIITGMFLAGIILFGFANQPTFQTNKNGCAGSGCHDFQAQLFSAKTLGNLSIRVKPKLNPEGSRISATLLDKRGRMVDFVENSDKESLLLNAPHAGRYKVLFATRHATAIWDSSWIDVSTPAISIPVSRFGTAGFKFFPVHPNPTSRAAVVRFTLPQSSHVELTLFSLGGRKLRTLYEADMEKGLQEIYFETRDAALHPLKPGTYLCQLRTDIKTLVQKIEIQ